MKYSSCLCGLCIGVGMTVTLVVILNDNGQLAIANKLLRVEYRDEVMLRQYGNNSSYDYRTQVLVYLHVQKTGGSEFIHHLVTATDEDGRHLCHPLPPSMTKHVHVRKEIVLCPFKEVSPSATQLPEMWLVSEKTFGWICGPHPLLSELKECVPRYYNAHYGLRARRYFFTTILRHPIMRSISEFMHIQRGAKWTYLHNCKGTFIGPGHMPPCYPGYYNNEHWAGLTLDKFIECDTNWAHNRQTIALADLGEAGCLDRVNTDRQLQDSILLKSAKRNLKDMVYFAIEEYMKESSVLLEYTLGLKLSVPMKQKQVKYLHTTTLAQQVWKNESLYNRMAQANHLDMQLYEYGVDLFRARLAVLNITINKNSLQKSILSL